MDYADHPYIEVLRTRAVPMLVVLAADFSIASAHAGLDTFLENYAPILGRSKNGRLPAALEQAIREATSPWFNGQVEDQSDLLRVGPRLAARVVLMRGFDGYCFAVTLERIALREDLGTAAQRFLLSDREATILPFLIKGESTTKIAETLSISQNTVREHVRHIYAKSGVRSRGELVSRVLNWNEALS